ncbi:MAG: acyltransferase [Microbacteriaceae bacterium]|nr:acyltransferase [Microbacteriaceae bacterium]
MLSEGPVRNFGDRFAHVDLLRAVAVLLVMFDHAGIFDGPTGGSGVTIFFALSGFIIAFLMLRERDKTGGFSPSKFYLRRVVKIAPPFVVIILIPTLIFSIWNAIDWSAVLSQILFYFNWIYAQGDAVVYPGSGVAWSLSIEEQFYLVFAVVWFILVRTRAFERALVPIAVLAITAPTILRFLLAVNDGNTARIYFGTDTRLDGIAWGILVAALYHGWVGKGSRPTALSRALGSDWALIVAVVVFAAALIPQERWFQNTFQYSLHSMATCVVVIFGMLPGNGPVRRLFMRLSVWRPAALIGLASYSIYLLHQSVIWWLMALLIGHLPGAPILLLALVSIAVAAGVGIVIYLVVERPARRCYLNGVARRRPTVEPAEVTDPPAVAQF